MAKSFKSSAYNFRPTAMSAAFSRAGLVSLGNAGMRYNREPVINLPGREA